MRVLCLGPGTEWSLSSLHHVSREPSKFCSVGIFLLIETFPPGRLWGSRNSQDSGSPRNFKDLGSPPNYINIKVTLYGKRKGTFGGVAACRPHRELQCFSFPESAPVLGFLVTWFPELLRFL